MKKLLLLLLFVFTLPAVATGISGASAPCDNATLSKYTGTADIEINWEPNTITLNWYNDNQKLEVPVAAQTCTYDGTVTVPPQPTKPGYTFNGWKVMGLPSGYTKLEYIEGGLLLNSYINLGFPATPTMQTLLTASVSAERSANHPDNVMFGASDQSAYAGGKAYSVDKYPNQVIIPNGNNGAPTQVYVTIILNTVYQFKINYPNVGIIGVDNTTKTGFTNITSVSSQNLYLFGFNGGGTYSTEYSVGKMKLYALTMWDNNRIIHNYIPAKNPSNVIGIYDTVTGAFLTNSGTGSFVAGPVVQ